MKECVCILFGGLLAAFAMFVSNQVTAPPSPEAQRVIELLDTSEGWRLGRNNTDCVVNEQKDLTIFHERASWRASTWKENCPLYVFGSIDGWYVSNHYNELRAKLVIQKLDK